MKLEELDDDAPPEPDDALLAQVRQRSAALRARQRRRTITAVAAATILVAGAVGVVWHNAGTKTPRLAVSGSSPRAKVSPGRVSASSTTRPATSLTASPSTPASSTTIATIPVRGRHVLPPATTPSVVSECSLPIDIGNDATITPTLCANAGINVTAWDYYAKMYPRFMGVGKSVSESTVLTLMCADEKSLPTMEQTSQLTARYYGWSFAASPAFEQWPFYPKPSGNECP